MTYNEAILVILLFSASICIILVLCSVIANKLIYKFLKYWRHIMDFADIIDMMDDDCDIQGFSEANRYDIPSCFDPEPDNPYPLCIGNKYKDCKNCCLYKDFSKGLE